jgi:curved DNA-binding protein CbpA
LKNHYQTLGLERTATQEQIKQAYRKLALKFHPDKNDGDKFFEERFKQTQEAYEILSDQYEKGRYDSDFDRFFYGSQSHQNTYTNQEYKKEKNEEPKVDPEVEKRKKEDQERRAKEDAEKNRIKEIKRKAELAFEDKAWIAIGSGFTMGILGIIMFVKYLSEGYNKKSQQVCVVAIVGFVILLIFSLLLTLSKSGNGH